MGDSKRQIVSGIAEYYNPDDLVNKQVIVCTNLKPIKLRGEESNGMILAAQEGDNLSLLTIDKNLSPGSQVS